MRIRLLLSLALSCLLFLLAGCSSVSQVGDIVRQGDEAYNAGNYEGAVSYYSSAIETEKSGSEIYNNRGMAYLKLEKYPEAEADFQAALSLDDKKDLYWNNLGLTLYYQDKLPEAKEAFSKAIALNNKETSYYLNHGDLAIALQSYEEAVEDYTSALSLDRTLKLAYHNRAAAYFNLGQYDKAVEDYTAGIEMDPGNLVLFWNRAESYRMLEQYQEALEDYQVYSALTSDLNADFYLKRAEVNVKLGKTDDAISDYSSAIRMGDAAPDAYYSRGMLYFEGEDYPSAREDFETYLSQAAPDAETEVILKGNIAYCDFIAQDYEKALEEITECIALSPDYAWAYYTRGQIYQALERYEEAKSDYDTANKLLGYGDEEMSDSSSDSSSESESSGQDSESSSESGS